MGLLGRRCKRCGNKFILGNADYCEKCIVEQSLEKCSESITQNLVEDEEIRLQFRCHRIVAETGTPGLVHSRIFSNGLLAFTNYDMIFMEAESSVRGIGCHQYLRVPLDAITGISRGTLFEDLKISTSTSPQPQTFSLGKGTNAAGITDAIEKLLNEVRQERKRLAKAALVKDAMPVMIFCKFCGARNKPDRSSCERCGAPLT